MESSFYFQGGDFLGAEKIFWLVLGWLRGLVGRVWVGVRNWFYMMPVRVLTKIEVQRSVWVGVGVCEGRGSNQSQTYKRD